MNEFFYFFQIFIFKVFKFTWKMRNRKKNQTSDFSDFHLSSYGHFLVIFLLAFSELRICRPLSTQKWSNSYERCGLSWIEWKTKSTIFETIIFRVTGENSSKIGVFLSTEEVFRTKLFRTSIDCEMHPNGVYFIHRTMCNVFFNNCQKLEKDRVRHDAVKTFKHRQSKRFREE